MRGVWWKVDHESLRDRLRLQNPQLAPEGLSGLVVLDEIHSHPEVARSWEGSGAAADTPASGLFPATQGGAELDLLLLPKGRRVGYEFKCAEQLRLTRST